MAQECHRKRAHAIRTDPHHVVVVVVRDPMCSCATFVSHGQVVDGGQAVCAVGARGGRL